MHCLSPPIEFCDHNNLILSVYAKEGQTIVDLPRNNHWESPDELWESPRIISPFVSFNKGVIDICKEGIYEFSGTISFFVENASADIIHGSALIRFINGDIKDRFTYDLKNVLVTKYFPGTIFPLQRPDEVTFQIKVTLSFNAIYKLTKRDIWQGNNTFAPQYMYDLFLYDDETWPKGLNVSRNTINVQTFMNVKEIE